MKYAFIIIVLTVLGFGHFYLWKRLISDLKWRGTLKVVLAGVFLLLGGLLIASFVFRHNLDRQSSSVMSYSLFLWMIVAFYCGLLFVFRDAIRLFVAFAKRVQKLFVSLRVNEVMDQDDPGGELKPHDPDRRLFFERAYAGFAIVSAASLTTWGVREAHGEFFLPEIEIGLERWKRQLDGLRIVQVSDLHVGPTIGAEEVARVARQVQALRPDIVALTGDFVDGSVQELGDDLLPLTQLKARFGTYFVTGNHELYSGVDEWVAFWRAAGIRVLEGECVAIGGPSGFDLAGIHDAYYGSRLGRQSTPPEMVVAGRNTDQELVLLAHQPIQIADAEAMGAGLQLSGHTHGGQILPFGMATSLAQPYLKGLYRHDQRTQIYVNAGTGYWGPPVRVGVPPEITTLILHSV